MSLLRQQRRIFCFFGRTVPDNRRACSALAGIGENFPNKQNVIFSKMTLLANMILSGIYTISKFTCAICSRLFRACVRSFHLALLRCVSFALASAKNSLRILAHSHLEIVLR